MLFATEAHGGKEKIFSLLRASMANYYLLDNVEMWTLFMDNALDCFLDCHRLKNVSNGKIKCTCDRVPDGSGPDGA